MKSNAPEQATNDMPTPAKIKATRGRPRDPNRIKRVIESASSQFLQNGFAATNMEAVAAASGVSKMTIYNYFPSKEALFECCVAERTDLIFSILKSGASDLSQMPEPTIVLEQVATQFLNLMRDDQVLGMHQVLIASASQHPSLCHSFFNQGPRRLGLQLTAYFQMLADAHYIELTSAERTADQFLSLFLGSPHLRCLLGLPKPSASEDNTLIQDSLAVFFRAYPIQNPAIKH
jgi:AcrR family transcriptional regulator